MSIRAKLDAVKEFVVKELEAIAAEAEKVAPVVETMAEAVASAIPGASTAAAIAEKIAHVAEAVIGCCGHSVQQHTQGGCSACSCKRTAAGARVAGAP